MAVGELAAAGSRKPGQQENTVPTLLELSKRGEHPAAGTREARWLHVPAMTGLHTHLCHCEQLLPSMATLFTDRVAGVR